MTITSDADVHFSSASVLSDVADELPAKREHQVVIYARCVWVDRDVRRKSSPATLLLGHGDQRRLQPRVLENGWMQLRDGVPESDDGSPNSCIRTGESGAFSFPGFLKILPRSEESLQCIVVQLLSQITSRALFCVESLGHEPAAAR